MTRAVVAPWRGLSLRKSNFRETGLGTERTPEGRVRRSDTSTQPTMIHAVVMT